MAFKFPFTNYHELNLTWVLDQLKALFEQSEENVTTIETYENRLTAVETELPSVSETASEASRAAAAAGSLAEKAKATADTAQNNAIQAQGLAGTARQEAQAAQRAADAATQAAQQAQATAQNFDGRITQAENDASQALEASRSFENRVQSAITTANNAARTATDAQGVAQNANQNAANALDTARTSDRKATAAQESAAAAAKYAGEALDTARTSDRKATAAQENAAAATETAGAAAETAGAAAEDAAEALDTVNNFLNGAVSYVWLSAMSMLNNDNTYVKTDSVHGRDFVLERNKLKVQFASTSGGSTARWYAVFCLALNYNRSFDNFLPSLAESNFLHLPDSSNGIDIYLKVKEVHHNKASFIPSDIRVRTISNTGALSWFTVAEFTEAVENINYVRVFHLNYPVKDIAILLYSRNSLIESEIDLSIVPSTINSASALALALDR